ncbi:Ureohydrolase [Suillus ampliporus]|nr:Ureohydrolase [Suillus ampliporus]
MSPAPSNKFLHNPKTIAVPQTGRCGQSTSFQYLGWRVVFDGHPQFEDISPPPNGTLNHSAVCESVASAVRAHTERGQLPVTLGGDHSLAMGTISSTLRLLGPLLRSPDSVLAKFEWVFHLPAERLVCIGLRDVDKGEKEILKQHHIKAFSAHGVDRYGIGKVVEIAVDHVNPQRDHSIHLSFDVDALDLSVRSSLAFREGYCICEPIHETRSLVALDLMEVNPALADAESVRQTFTVGCSLVRSVFDKRSEQI